MAYQFSLATGLSGLMQKKKNVPNNQGFELREEGALPVVALLEGCNKDEPLIVNIKQCLDMVKNLNITAWLKDHPNCVDPNAVSLSRASKSPYDAACTHSSASVQDSIVATLGTSLDGRVACHKLWGAVLGTSVASPCIVLPAVAPDFEDILCASGFKSNHTRIFGESLNDLYEEVAHNPYKAYLDKEVSVLNLLPPNLALEETTACVSAEKTVSIKGMLDMPVTKRSKASTSINTSSLCQTKENVLECDTNWLSLLNHNYNIDDTAPPILYGTFFNLANLIANKEYKIWYGCSVHKHVDQLQQIMSGIRKLASTPALIRQVLAGRSLDSAPFLPISNAAADLVQDIEICTQLGSLGQIFADPSVLYKRLTPKPDTNPTTLPNKHPRPSPEKSDDSELVKKWRNAEKEGWLKMSSRCSFHPPADFFCPVLQPAHHCGLQLQVPAKKWVVQFSAH
eukprot:1183504-Ditylum_brightwellii.AAC.2